MSQSASDKMKSSALKSKFNQRITIAKHGREHFLNKDYVNATKKYTEYLRILAEAHSLDDIYELSPKKFRSKEDLTEMLLISQIYWELSRIYEMTPKLLITYEKCLKQFIRFTINQPYQVLNSEMLRKYIKKYKRSSPRISYLEKAYSQIQTESKKCIIATHTLSNTHWVTGELRKFKSTRLTGKWGSKFVGFYYTHSDMLLNYLVRRPTLSKYSRYFLVPILYSLGLLARTSNSFNGERD